MRSKNKTKKLKSLLFVFIVLFASCAEKKPDVEPDRSFTIQDLIKDPVTLKTGSSAFQANGQGAFLTASSESAKFMVKKVVASATVLEELEELFLSLPVSSQGSLKVVMGLTEGVLTAYKVVSPREFESLSALEQQLATTKFEHQSYVEQGFEKISLNLFQHDQKLIPIVQLPLNSYGRIEHVENDVGEKTRTLKIVGTPFASATHVILAETDARKIPALPTETLAKEVYLAKTVDEQLTTAGELEFALDVELGDLADQASIYTKVVGKQLKVFLVTSYHELTVKEKRAFDSGAGNYFNACPGDAAAIESSDCVLKLVFGLDLQTVVVERVKGDNLNYTGSLTAKSPLVGVVDERLIKISRKTRPIKYDINNSGAIDGVDPGKILKVADLKGKEYLFRRTLQDSPNNFNVTFAGTAGKLEIVKFDFQENSVRVLRSQPLLSVGGNTGVDNEPLMELPARFVKVESTDSQGNPLAVDRIVDTDVSDPKALAIVSWENNVIPNTSSPLNFYGLENCFSGARSRKVEGIDHRLAENGILNFTHTVTYSASTAIDCAGLQYAGYFDRAQSIFTFKERISFKEYDTSLDNRDPLNIPYAAQKKLGYGVFTYNKKLPDHNGQTGFSDNELSLPAVFDLSKGQTITYVLGGLPDHNQGETVAEKKRNNSIRRSIIRGTQEVVHDLNVALRAALAGTPKQRNDDIVQLVVEGENGVAKKEIGDLDVNYIYYVQKPTELPIIGLGGSHSNPRVGFVEAASVFMYGGNMLKAVGSMKRRAEAKRLYEKMTEPEIDFGANAEDPDAEPNGEDGTAVAGSPVGGEANEEDLVNHIRPHDERSVLKLAEKIKPVNASDVRSLQNALENIRSFDTSRIHLETEDLKGIMNSKAQKFFHAHKSLKESGAYSANRFQKQHFEQGRLAQVYADAFGAQSYEFDPVMANMRANNICVRQAADIPLDGIPLSEDQMSDVDLLKGMWVATLAHELGHNFGLRHNFVGSFDAANFKFHPGEASGRTYSSIMDYLVDDHVTYDGFGPYDVAALRAAYTGMVELHPAVQGQVNGRQFITGNGKEIDVASGRFVNINDIKSVLDLDDWRDLSMGDLFRAVPIKNYSFCSDEDVLYTPTCNRFDQGTTPVQVVESMIQRYKEGYALTNFANNRLNFNRLGDGAYIGRLFSMFIPARMFLEETIFQLIMGADIQGVVIPYAQAAVAAMDFFHNVIRTPDASFAMDIKRGKLTDPTDSDVDRFVEVSVPSPMGNLVLKVETKWLQDIGIDGDPSRLQARGVEFDKVIALIMLTERSFGFSRYEDISLRMSFPDFEKLVFGIENPAELPTITLLQEIIQDKVTGTGVTPLGNLPLDPTFKVETTELMRAYAILGAILNLDVDGLEAQDNTSVLFRIFNDLDAPARTPVMTKLGSNTDLIYWAEEDNLVSQNVILNGAVTQALINRQDLLAPLMQEWIGLAHPELAPAPLAVGDGELGAEEVAGEVAEEAPAEDAEERTIEEVEMEINSLLADLPPELIGINNMAIIGMLTSQIYQMGASLEPALGQSPQGFQLQVEGLANQVETMSRDNPVLSMSLEQLGVLGTAPASVSQILPRSNESRYGTMFRNVEMMSSIFQQVHPEYFR